MFIIAAYEGQCIRVGNRMLKVGLMRSPGLVDVLVDNETEPFCISADRKTEIFPDVFLAMERNLHMGARVKFLFEAPSTVRIRELPHDPEP